MAVRKPLVLGSDGLIQQLQSGDTTPGGSIISNFVFGLKRTTGVPVGKLGGYWTCPFAGTITAWNITASAGTITIGIWKVATASPPVAPTSANAIVPLGVALSSGTGVHSTNLSGFNTTAVAVGDIFAAEIISVAGVTDFGGSIEITRS